MFWKKQFVETISERSILAVRIAKFRSLKGPIKIFFFVVFLPCNKKKSLFSAYRKLNIDELPGLASGMAKLGYTVAETLFLVMFPGWLN